METILNAELGRLTMKVQYSPDLPYAVNRAIEDSIRRYNDDVGSFLRANEPFDIQLSVTTLNKTPRQVQLFKRHSEEMNVNVWDRLHLLDGSIFHYLLEEYPQPGCKIEERLGFKVSYQGKVILIHGALDWRNIKEQWLNDHKRAKVSKFIYEDEEALEEDDDYTVQLNVLKLIVEKKTRDKITRLTNFFSLKDWHEGDMIKDQTGKYPKRPMFYKDRPVWDNEKTMEILKARIKKHVQSVDLPDDDLPFCSDKERWKRDMFRVVGRNKPKKGETVGEWSKASKGTFKKLSEAQEVGATIGEHRIDTLPGFPTKCMKFCDCAPFCNQRQKEIEEQRNKQEAIDDIEIED